MRKKTLQSKNNVEKKLQITFVTPLLCKADDMPDTNDNLSGQSIPPVVRLAVH